MRKVSPPRVIKVLEKGLQVEGFYLGRRGEFVLLRNLDEDVLVPRVKALEALDYRIVVKGRLLTRLFWVSLHFIDFEEVEEVSLTPGKKVQTKGGVMQTFNPTFTGSKKIWTVEIRVLLSAPHGVRGALRRQGRRLP